MSKPLTVEQFKSDCQAMIARMKAPKQDDRVQQRAMRMIGADKMPKKLEKKSGGFSSMLNLRAGLQAKSR